MISSFAIHIRDLRKTYIVSEREAGVVAALKSLVHRQTEEIPAVAGISFDVTPGEIVGFLGPNGAGKTTTLKFVSPPVHFGAQIVAIFLDTFALLRHRTQFAFGARQVLYHSHEIAQHIHSKVGSNPTGIWTGRGLDHLMQIFDLLVAPVAPPFDPLWIQLPGSLINAIDPADQILQLFSCHRL